MGRFGKGRRSALGGVESVFKNEGRASFLKKRLPSLLPGRMRDLEGETRRQDKRESALGNLL